MALDATKLDVTGSGSKGAKTLAHYETTDTMATVMASGYFDSVYRELARVGAMMIVASDGVGLATVSISGTTVTLGGLVSAGSPYNLTAATLTLGTAQVGRPVTVNKADGTTITLPAATGSGKVYEILVGTTITSNNLIIQVVGNDTMTGKATFAADGGDTVVSFETAADSDTITMNGTTKGGIKGDRIRLVDMAADLWHVVVDGSATGSEATPFSAAVS